MPTSSARTSRSSTTATTEKKKKQRRRRKASSSRSLLLLLRRASAPRWSTRSESISLHRNSGGSFWIFLFSFFGSHFPPRPSTLKPKKNFKKLQKKSYFGTPVVEGPDFVVASAAECCNACASYKPVKVKKQSGGEEKRGEKEKETDPSLDCSLWVFCGDEEQCGEAFGQCWLKHLAWPEASNPLTGPEVPWTSGLRSGRLSPALEEEREEEEKRKKGEKVERRRSPPPSSSTSVSSSSLPLPPSTNRRAYHVAITASGPAVHWQSRVHYYWYLKQKKLCEEEEARANEEATAAVSSTSKPRRFRCDMGGFTRVLHDAAGTPDDLCREIPTFVASPLPAGADGGYVVLNRPWAFVQWLSAARIEEEFILMAEPDHLWLKPFQNPCPPDGSPAAFPFFYIEPSKTEYLPLVARALGRKTGRISREEAEEIAPIGNSPTWMRTRDLTQLAPLWLETSVEMFRDAETKAAWGWVLEMYGFAVSLHKKKAEKGRLAEEAAVLRAAVSAAAENKKTERGSSSLSSSSSLSFFPPLSSEVSEAALEARRAFRREKRRRRHRRRKEGDDDSGGEERGGGGGDLEPNLEIEKAEGKVKVLPRVMLQPPWDSRITPGAALLHYTYGCDYSLNGTFLPGERGEWRFDKREWAAAPPTRAELRRSRDGSRRGRGGGSGDAENR